MTSVSALASFNLTCFSLLCSIKCFHCDHVTDIIMGHVPDGIYIVVQFFPSVYKLLAP